MMKQFKVPTLSPTAQKAFDRRTKLMGKAKRKDNKRATQALEEEYSLRVYSKAEIKAFVKERPELLTDAVIGKQEWDTTKPNFMR